MVQALSTAKALDWRGWLLGIMGAVVSGGAGAVGSGAGEVLLDPGHAAAAGGMKHVLALMGMTFLVSAAISLAKYLQTKPVPNAVNGQ